MWLCLGVLGLRVNQLTGRALTQASRIPPPFALPLLGSSKQNQSITKVKNIYTRTAQPARLPRELTIAHFFDVNLFCSLHYWGLVLDLTWSQPRLAVFLKPQQ
jgi:hypothetical protein